MTSTARASLAVSDSLANGQLAPCPAPAEANLRDDDDDGADDGVQCQLVLGYCSIAIHN